jgi:hypothetical protein
MCWEVAVGASGTAAPTVQLTFIFKDLTVYRILAE